MKKFLHYLVEREWKIPQTEKYGNAIRAFSLTEKVIFYAFVAIFVGTGLYLLNSVNNAVSVLVPAYGGTLTEGVIGAPRFVNPLLAISDTDRDLVELTYSGLLRADSTGKLLPDLAESYSVSDDGLVYTFILKNDALWSDGEKVTADDVIFTIEKAQSATLKSPKRANWDGIVAEKVDGRTVKLSLKQAYAPFLQNATMGILPRHIWKDTSDEQFPFSPYNIEPVGTGPYVVKSVEKNANGVPLSYTLHSSSDYVGGEAFITTFIFKFYPNEESILDALGKGQIESASSISPKNVVPLVKSGTHIEKAPLPRIFGVFFDQNEQPIFAHPEVRQALDKAIDKDKLIADVLLGFGTKVSSPIPPGLLKNEPSATPTGATSTPTERAIAILTKAGWRKNPDTGRMEKAFQLKGRKDTETESLSFSLATSNTPELKQAADILKTEWEKIGAEVSVKVYEAGDLNQNVIRPRKYDALLFGEIVGRELDLFAFWHSSQRIDPGLNIALYANVKADKILEESRTISNEEARLELYRDFEKEIFRDMPAVFLYSPDFIYIVPEKVHGFEQSEITVPSDRFQNVNKWYIQTDKVWKIFAK